MRLSSRGFSSLIVAVGLCGCQVQNTTVVDQTAAMGSTPNHVARRVPQPSPCAAPAGTGPFERLSRPASSAPVAMPAKAVAEHVRGCAGVRFRIGSDGVPRDVAVLTEYPLGYGFANTAREVVVAIRWAPKDDMAWRYLIVNMRPHAVPKS